MGNVSWPLQRLLEICNSRYAPLVRRLHVGYSYFDHPGSHEWAPGSRYYLYAEDASRLLPVCIARLSCLEALDVCGPSFPWTIASVAEEPTRLFTNAIVSVLRYVELPCLTELNLRLPVTHEFGELFTKHPSPSRIPVRDVMRRLRHLKISVSDFTVDDPSHTRGAPRSALRDAYPNADFVASPLKLIELSAGLESLAIRSSDMLNVDALELHDDVSLRSLKLSMLYTTATALMRILEHSRDSLRAVDLHMVELSDGVWDEVLHKLCACPHLWYWSISASGYSSSGSNEHLRLPSPQSQGVETRIASKNAADHDALWMLLDHIRENRVSAGIPHCDL